MKEQLGVTCPKCKVFTPAGGWAAAHAHLDLYFTCPECGYKITVPAGTL